MALLELKHVNVTYHTGGRDVYAVKGYDTGFRICLRVEWTEPDGSAVLWILFLDRFNGSLVINGDVASVESALKNVLHMDRKNTDFLHTTHDK